MPVRRTGEGALRSANPRLAARLPGGTAWGGREAPMWKRSEVEQLTGLSRHTIQDLCNKNTSRDGLGFWEPAVIKPGYSRFDEGDLLAFYLVRLLVRAGFAPAEVGPAVLGMTGTGDEFAAALKRKACDLHKRRVELESQLAALERLDEAVGGAPEERLYDVMASELAASASRALDAAESDLVASDALRTKARAWLGEVAGSLVPAIHGDAITVCLEDIEACLSRPSEEGVVSHERALAARALAHFLSEPENGVPIELAFGKGSFSRLRTAAQSWSLP